MEGEAEDEEQRIRRNRALNKGRQLLLRLENTTIVVARLATARELGDRALLTRRIRKVRMASRYNCTRSQARLITPCVIRAVQRMPVDVPKRSLRTLGDLFL